MNLKVIYNDVDITNEIEISRLTMHDRLGGVLDNITLQYPITIKESVDLGVNKDDVIVITTDDYSSGKMYVDSFKIDINKVTIEAISCSEKAKVSKSKIWRNVRLLEIANDVAKNYELQLKTYGITDYTYESISQIEETDMSLLDRICKREGYSIKVDNGYLIIFNDLDLESEKSLITLKESEVRKNYFFKTNKSCKSYTVSCFNVSKGIITHTSINDEISVGVSKSKIEFLSNINEAIRFSKNYLNNENKNVVTGNLSFEYNPKISAGTVIEIEGFANFDGKYIVTKTSHDVVLKITSIEIRKVGVYK